MNTPEKVILEDSSGKRNYWRLREGEEQRADISIRHLESPIVTTHHKGMKTQKVDKLNS